MKIKRFLDKDSRRAMARVRAELGREAVILSNKTVDGQIEIMAAIDVDEVALMSNAELSSPHDVMDLTVPGDDSPTLNDLQRELGNLRNMLEGKLSQLAWRDMADKPSVKAALYSRLSRLGLSRVLCGEIVDSMPTTRNLEGDWKNAQDLLSQRMHVMPGDELLNSGGVVAIVGSTGVGKTTTIAKLAARFVMRHGSKQVALISTDSFRIGGQEQLETFASYLGVPVVVATDGKELQQALDKLVDRKLVLIDTAGMSQRDVRLYEQFSTLKSVGHDIDVYIALSATAQQRALSEAVQVFGKEALAGAVITKMDEATGIGGLLDVIIRNRLKLSYVGTGQKVPEDLIPARVEYLMEKAVELMEEELMASENDRQIAMSTASVAG
jgi:flagellar biosynthesis protein FlhF